MIIASHRINGHSSELVHYLNLESWLGSWGYLRHLNSYRQPAETVGNVAGLGHIQEFRKTSVGSSGYPHPLNSYRQPPETVGNEEGSGYIQVFRKTSVGSSGYLRPLGYIQEFRKMSMGYFEALECILILFPSTWIWELPITIKPQYFSYALVAFWGAAQSQWLHKVSEVTLLEVFAICVPFKPSWPI